MIAPNRAPQHTVRSPKNCPTPASETVTYESRADTAANDDTEATVDLFRDPLWVMAIALGVFCAVVALVIAFG